MPPPQALLDVMHKRKADAIDAEVGYPATLPLTTKGDLLAQDSSAPARLPVGSDGQVLEAASGETTGLKWGAKSSLDVKSGTVSVTENGEQAVTFNTAFSDTPRVTLTVEGGEWNLVRLKDGTVSTTGFTIEMDKPGGGPADSYTVYWIATDAGDP